LSKYTFNKGDIVHLQFDPQAGREMKGKHYALVLSNSHFNQSELALVAPITQGNYHREGGFTNTLMGSGTHTSGLIVANAAKILDLRAREASFKETCPDYILDEVVAKFETIL
jgi:mRNA interferase ChpB